MNAPDTPESQPAEHHRGHDLESGVLSRLREWTDIFPWLRLGRTLRLAGSPPVLLIVSAALFVWLLVLGLFDVRPLGRPGQLLVGPRISDQVLLNDSVFTESIRLGGLPMLAGLPSRLLDSNSLRQAEPLHGGFRLLICLVSLLIWTPVLLLLLRQGALLTAGREMTGLGESLKFVLRRTPAGWWAAFIPFVCVALLAIPIVLAGWLEHALGGISILAWPLSLVLVLLAIPCGLLAFGAAFAVPLSWAAIANEPVPDPLDALSRGYEYLYRRPLQLALYTLIGAVVLWVVMLLATGISGSALGIAGRCLGSGPLVGGNVGALPEGEIVGPSLAARTAVLLLFVPVIVTITLFWGLLGGVYLLLRRDAGGQEVEDLWLPPSEPAEPLPNLPTDPARSDL